MAGEKRRERGAGGDRRDRRLTDLPDKRNGAEKFPRRFDLPGDFNLTADRFMSRRKKISLKFAAC
jgi:hypothetical protein